MNGRDQLFGITTRLLTATRVEAVSLIGKDAGLRCTKPFPSCLPGERADLCLRTWRLLVWSGI
jgi:hypothetical protein